MWRSDGIIITERSCGIIITGKTEGLGENLYQYHFVHHKILHGLTRV
jgi:hypothetical protein